MPISLGLTPLEQENSQKVKPLKWARWLTDDKLLQDIGPTTYTITASLYDFDCEGILFMQPFADHTVGLHPEN